MWMPSVCAKPYAVSKRCGFQKRLRLLIYQFSRGLECLLCGSGRAATRMPLSRRSRRSRIRINR